MKCPVDETLLVITDRQGVEIDYCPQCRGVWLDRGELDKLIDRVADHLPEPRRDHDDRHDERRDQGDRSRFDYPGGKRKKKKSLLGEFFEFGD